MANNLLPSLAMGIRRDGNQSSGLAGWLTEDQENQSNWDETQIDPDRSHRCAALPALMPLSVGGAFHSSELPRYSALPSLMPLSVYGEPDERYAEPLIHPSLNDRSGEEYEDIPLSAKANLMGNSNLQVPQSQKVKPGKAELQGRGLYKVDFPISKSLSARVGVAPNGNIVKRVKDPYIDKEKDMVYLRLNYHF